MSLSPRALLLTATLGLASCSGRSGNIVARGEGLDTSALPVEVRTDYGVFAHRCSKCHSLTRALNSGISDDDYWFLYVERMRRQPASGIAPDDVPVILRFLHYYSEELKRSHKATRGASAQPQRRL